MRAETRLAVGLLALPVLWVLAAGALHVVGSLASAPDRADVAVVPGCGVTRDGEPTRCLADRVGAAVALWEAGRVGAVLVTGGASRWPHTEGEVGAAWATSLGMPADAVLVETEATSTEENAALGAAMLPADATLVVVTDRFHVARARTCFAWQREVVGAVGVAAPWGDTLRGALREVAAWGQYVAWGQCGLRG